MVLHFESKNADHRLIDALLGERPIPERLLDRIKIGRHFPEARSSKNNVVAGFEGEHRCLGEAPLRIDARHEERIGHDYAIIAQLPPQDLRDKRVRQFRWHHRVNGRH